MANTVTPNQKIIIDPNSDIFDLKNRMTRAYQSYVVNKLNKVIGENTVVDGLEIKNPKINNLGVVSLKVTPGSCIVSSNYISVISESSLDISIGDYLFDGGIIVHCQYNSQNSINAEKMKIRLSIHGPGPDYLIYPGPWIFGSDTLIIGYLLYTRSPFSLVNLTPTIGSKSYSINICGSDYDVRPTGNILKGISERTTPTYEEKIITQNDIDRKFFELHSAPIDYRFLEIMLMKSGLKLISKDNVDNLGIPNSQFINEGNLIVKKPADYKLIGRKVYIKNDPSAGVSDLNEDIKVGDILIVRYLHG